MSAKKTEAHSSYVVWLIYNFRAIEKILPALKGKSKYGWLPGLGLCIIVLLASVGFGIYTDGYGIHPPAQYTGICAPPATIQKGNCVLITTQVVTVSGTATAVKQTAQAGVILNQTASHK